MKNNVTLVMKGWYINPEDKLHFVRHITEQLAVEILVIIAKYPNHISKKLEKK